MKRLLKKTAMVVILFAFGYRKNGHMYTRSGYGNMSKIWFSDQDGKETIHGLVQCPQLILFKFALFHNKKKSPTQHFDLLSWR